MGLLRWEDRYSVGIAAVDYEHQELIERWHGCFLVATSRSHDMHLTTRSSRSG